MHTPFVALTVLLPLALAYPGKPSPLHYQCTYFDVPMSFEATSLQPSFPPFKSHYDSVLFLTTLSSRTARDGPAPFNNSSKVNVNVTIAAQFCAPKGRPWTTLQILSHGLGFDHSYWSFGGDNSEYNYVSAATAAGYSTLSYDRIGNGQSSKPDAYSINQGPIETEVLAVLTKHARSWDIPCLSHYSAPRKIVHVGHSFGSQITNELVAQYPNISDGAVFTGYSTVPSQYIGFPIAANYHLAKDVLPQIYGNLSTGYVIWGDELANQYNFLHWPYFSPEILAAAENSKWPWSVSEMLSTRVYAAGNYTKPVMIISGQYDGVFCQYNCTGQLETAAATFPSAQPFRTYIQPHTGHGINLHYNATGAYRVINDFIGEHIDA